MNLALEPEGSAPLSKKALKEGIRDVLGGGSDVDAANPLPITPGVGALFDVSDRAARLVGKIEINQGGVATSNENPIPVQSVLAEEKARIFREGIVANTDILGDEIVTTETYPVTWRIYSCFTTSGILTVHRRMAGFTRTENLNAGVALTAGAAYMFDIIVQVGENIEFQYTVNAWIDTFKVVELKGMV